MKNTPVRNLLLILSLLFVYHVDVVAKEVELKYNGIKYIVDIEQGTARVSRNYTNNKGTLEGDVVIDSIVYYKKQAYRVTSIGSLAFLCYDEVSSLTIPNSIVEIDPLWPPQAKGFNRISVMPGNIYFQSVDGVLFNKKMTELICYPNGLGASTYVIPSTVVTIGEYAFRFSHLDSVTLPASVVRVGEQAFAYCSDLVSVIKQNRDIVIHPDAFHSSNKLTAENIVYQVPANLFLELAQKGNPEDQYNLALCYYNGEGFPKDNEAALEWLEKAANQGHKQSQYWAGSLYFENKQVAGNIEKAVAWMSKAADTGMADAQTAMGYFYLNGLGVAQNTETALHWLTQAAQQNEQEALTNLGHIYYNGQIVEQDIDKAVSYYKKVTAADTSVTYNLAYCYYQGTGVQKDDKEALRLLEKAVRSGHVQGQRLYCLLNYNEAVSNMNTELYTSAISRFTSVLTYDQANVDAYINRGYCYLQTETKDYIHAEEDFRKCARVGSGGSGSS